MAHEVNKLELQPVAGMVEDNSDTFAPQLVVDPARERAILRKLDIRIVPMIMALYLLSFMDRGELLRRFQMPNTRY
jgi:hypothetical protein